jgi:hypothetical protein
MISIWAFVIAVVVFMAILFWERWDYKKLYGYVETLEYFLDMYISQYGTLPGITEMTKEDTNADNTK